MSVSEDIKVETYIYKETEKKGFKDRYLLSKYSPS